jgi:hypothetical protein
MPIIDRSSHFPDRSYRFVEARGLPVDAGILPGRCRRRGDDVFATVSRAPASRGGHGSRASSEAVPLCGAHWCIEGTYETPTIRPSLEITLATVWPHGS